MERGEGHSLRLYAVMYILGNLTEPMTHFIGKQWQDSICGGGNDFLMQYNFPRQDDGNSTVQE